MSKQIKPGMLCIISGSENTSLNGIIVEVLRKAAYKECFTNTPGMTVNFVNCDWVCTSKNAMSCWNKLGVEIGPCHTRAINSSILIPISDPDIELTEEEDISTIMQQKDKFVAEQHRNRVE